MRSPILRKWHGFPLGLAFSPRLFAAVAALLLTDAHQQQHGTRPRLSLDGEWELGSVTPAPGRGVEDGSLPHGGAAWTAAVQRAPPAINITVPGAWGSQGVGTQWTCAMPGPGVYCQSGFTAKHHLYGSAVYARRVQVPAAWLSAPPGSTVVLVLERVYTTSKVSVNGVALGTGWTRGRLSPHEHVMPTPLPKVLELRVSVRADNLRVPGSHGTPLHPLEDPRAPSQDPLYPTANPPGTP